MSNFYLQSLPANPAEHTYASFYDGKKRGSLSGLLTEATALRGWLALFLFVFLIGFGIALPVHADEDCKPVNVAFKEWCNGWFYQEGGNKVTDIAGCTQSCMRPNMMYPRETFKQECLAVGGKFDEENKSVMYCSFDRSPSPEQADQCQKTFTDPMYEGMPLDHCLYYSSSCSGEAANEWCKQQGYVGASAFEEIGSSQTKIIGDGEVCPRYSGGPCGKYSSITCNSCDPSGKKPPQANFTLSPSEGTTPLTVTCDGNSSTDSDGSITNYQWSTSDGKSASGTTASFVFDNEGDYTVTLTVTDDQGKMDTTQQMVKVHLVNCKTVSNVTVCADSIEEIPPNSKVFTAKGNIKLARADGNKVLSVGTDVQLDTAANTVETLGQGDITALAIKSNPNDAARDMLLYSGGFSLNASSNPPQLALADGVAKIIAAGFFSKLNTITLNSDEVVLEKVETNPIANFLLEQFFTFEDIVLSQSGESSREVKASVSDILKFKPYKIGKSNWKVGELEFALDIFKPSFTATAGFEIPGLFKGKDGGIGVTLGFLLDPFALETVGGSLSKDDGFISLPTTPPSPIGASLNDGSFEVDNISSGRPLQMTGTVGMSLTDAVLILPTLEDFIKYKVLSGEVALLLDLSGKVELSGEVNLLEKFPLANAKLSVSKPTSFIEGNITIGEILNGREYLAISALSNFLEMTGQAGLTFHTPPKTPIIGEQLFSSSVLSTLRFNSQQIDLAEFVTHYQEKFVDVTLRLDITDVTNPHVYITGWGKTIQVRSADGLRAGERQVITIDKDYDTVMLVATSDQSAALFNLTLPDGTQYTPMTAPAADSTAVDIFFKRNEAAHEAYYALKKPAQGNYTVEITNATDLGNYQVELWIPSPKPTIALTSLSTDQTWDGITPINITWTDNDPSNKAKVSLYYDTDNQGNNGNLIVADILASETSKTYQWTPSSGLQSGNYYLYAKIDDRDNLPVFTYSQGKLIVSNPKAPATPQNVVAAAGDGIITVTWIANSEPNLMSYRVYVSDTPGDDHYEHDFGIGLDTSYEIRGLKNSKTYEIAVSAINEDSLESLRSSPLQQMPIGNTTQGNAEATDAQGKETTSISQFKGEIAVNGGVFQPSATLNLADMAEVRGNITVDITHLGQPADLFVYAGYKPTPDSEETFYMMDSPNACGILKWEENIPAQKVFPCVRHWDKDPASLGTLKKNVILTSDQVVRMYNDKFIAPGYLRIFFGYRLQDGTVVMSRENVDVTIH